jgi:hypothetical protein
MMQNSIKLVPFKSLGLALMLAALTQAGAQSNKDPYPAMAPLDQYMMAPDAEIALARSAAPASISDNAEVMVLRPQGYTTAVKGSNGFLCIVERGWAADTGNSDFWNPNLRGPLCLNPAAARSVEPIYLMRTKLILAGKSKAEMLAATDAAFDKKELSALEPGAMCYMLSKKQYLGDGPKAWHPHLMFFVSGDAAKSWGADQSDSPVMAANFPEEKLTIFMVVLDNWSDGSPGPSSGDHAH